MSQILNLYFLNLAVLKEKRKVAEEKSVCKDGTYWLLGVTDVMWLGHFIRGCPSIGIFRSLPLGLVRVLRPNHSVFSIGTKSMDVSALGAGEEQDFAMFITQNAYFQRISLFSMELSLASVLASIFLSRIFPMQPLWRISLQSPARSKRESYFSNRLLENPVSSSAAFPLSEVHLAAHFWAFLGFCSANQVASGINEISASWFC